MKKPTPDKVKWDSGLARLGPAVFRVKLVENEDGKDVLLIFARPRKGARVIFGEGKAKKYAIIAVMDGEKRHAN